MREFSVPAQVAIAESANLTDTLFSRAAEEPDRIAFRRKDGGGWSGVTAREFAADVRRLAKALARAGVELGDRVAIMSRSRYEWTVADYATWAAGGVAVPIYETSSASQVEWILGDSGAKVVFVESDEHEKAVASIRGGLPELTTVWRMDDLPSDTVAGLSDDAFEERRASRTAGDLATIIYTSGTTGRPKGCEITHANLLATARNVVEGALAQVFGLKDGSTLLFLPLAHVFARLIEVGCVEGGVILGHTPDLTDLVGDLGSFRPTFLLAVPRVFEKVYNGAEQKATAEGKGKIFHLAADTAIAYSRAGSSLGVGLRVKHALFDKLVYGKLRAAVGGRVTHAVSGGAALGERLGHFFNGVGITILEGYGLTETTAPASVNLPGDNRIGTVGRPIPGSSVRIADDGEVLVKGPNVFAGYWHNEEASRQALDDGWFRTGDVGELNDGYLRITGRKKEIIVTAGGKNVAPGPIEDRLRAHPLISQCMVVGDGRKFIACLITLDPEALEPWREQHGKAGLSTAELASDPDLVAEIDAAVAEANTSVSRAEGIKKYHILDTDFTEESGHLTPTLKVKRNLVMKDFAGEIDSLYA